MSRQLIYVIINENDLTHIEGESIINTSKTTRYFKKLIFFILIFTAALLSKNASLTLYAANNSIVSANHQKYTYSEMKRDIIALTKKYEGKISYTVIGTTVDNRNIYDVIIGNPDAPKVLLVTSTIHAREYMCSLLCMKQIEYYLENYNTKINGVPIKKTLDKICIHYIPMVNPDGVTISQYGIKKIKNKNVRKKLKKMGVNSGSAWKSNANGVDLNYNFPYKFRRRGQPGMAYYHGKKALSENESKAIYKLVNSLGKRLVGAINYHAMGSIVIGGCSGSRKLKAKTNSMSQTARTVTGYYDGNSYNSGIGFREYILYKKKKPSITIEIGIGTTPVPINQFQSIWKKNKNLVIREAMLFV